jgi:hypothetical protein
VRQLTGRERCRTPEEEMQSSWAAVDDAHFETQNIHKTDPLSIGKSIDVTYTNTDLQFRNIN